MLSYNVAGRNGTVTATADRPYAILWNASSAKSIYVTEIGVTKTVATVDNHALVRVTARGTAGSTITPDADCHDDNQTSPESSAVLDLGDHSVAPTVSAPYKRRLHLPAVIGSGYVWTFPKGMRVKAGEGLGIVTPTAVAGQACDIYFAWEE